MKRRKTKKLTPFSLILIILSAYLIFFTGKYQFQLIKLRKQREELIEQINSEKQLQQQYTAELDRVGTDEYYEYLARRYLGYIYPDEKVLVWVD